MTSTNLSIVRDGTAPYINREELRAFAHSGVSIGSHSVRHPNLLLLEPSALRVEPVESLRLVRSVEGINAIAYPFGEHDATVRVEEIAAGYRVLLQADGTNRAALPYAIARIPVSATTTPEFFGPGVAH